MDPRLFDGQMDSKKVFRLLDLLAEIRITIYTYLLKTPEHIKLTVTYKGRPRAVQQSFEQEYDHWLLGLKTRNRSGKWLGQGSSNFAIAHTSKQVAAETMPLIYGLNTFEFGHIHDLNNFLGGLSPSTIQCLKSLHLRGGLASPSRARPFSRLPGATTLSSLTISHRAVRSEGKESGLITSPSALAHNLRLFLSARCTAQEEDADGVVGVFDAVKIVCGEICLACEGQCSRYCREAAQAWVPDTLKGRDIVCNGPEVEEHVSRMNEELRTAIARKLGIEEKE